VHPEPANDESVVIGGMAGKIGSAVWASEGDVERRMGGSSGPDSELEVFTLFHLCRLPEGLLGLPGLELRLGFDGLGR
jgi:hypothetical protein